MDATIRVPLLAISAGMQSPDVPLADAVAAGMVPPAVLASMNHGCPFCRVVFLADVTDLEGIAPDTLTSPGGYAGFREHLPACMRANQQGGE